MPAFDFEESVYRILQFLRDVGIGARLGDVRNGSFLPGIDVIDGALVVDVGKLKYPGDLLHEAGHLAVTPAADRAAMSGEVVTPNSMAEFVELEAILWSYAACVHLGLDPRIVFHSDGYHGSSEALLLNFSLGVFPGLIGLESEGMTLSPAAAERLGELPFPKMRKWLRD